MTGGDEVFHPDTARVAVIDRDGNADGISSALRSYLALDGEMVDLADDSEALQQAVASNYVDLIAIVPHGFASDYQKYLDGSSNDQPTVETVVSYTSGAGSLSQLEVNEFLSLTRTATWVKPGSNSRWKRPCGRRWIPRKQMPRRRK